MDDGSNENVYEKCVCVYVCMLKEKEWIVKWWMWSNTAPWDGLVTWRKEWDDTEDVQDMDKCCVCERKASHKTKLLRVFERLRLGE